MFKTPYEFLKGMFADEGNSFKTPYTYRGANRVCKTPSIHKKIIEATKTSLLASMN
jgi:hypothetical protein